MYIVSLLLDIATCLTALASLWIRRRTWRCYWEQPKTLGLLFLTIGVVARAAPVAWPVQGLHLLVAHIFILGGIACIAYSAERKLRTKKDMRTWAIRFLIVPLIIAYIAMVVLFIKWPTADAGYASVGWLTYDLLAVYFLGLCAYSLWCLWRDPPSRVAAAVYLIAVGFGLVTATCRALVVAVNDEVPDEILVNVASAANSIALMLFAGGAAWMWLARVQQGNTCLRGRGAKPRTGPMDLPLGKKPAE